MVKKSASNFFVATVCKKLKAGVTPELATPPSNLPTLHNTTIGRFIDVWKYLRDNPDIVQHAWGACHVPRSQTLSLSHTSISSDEAFTAF